MTGFLKNGMSLASRRRRLSDPYVSADGEGITRHPALGFWRFSPIIRGINVAASGRLRSDEGLLWRD